MRRRREGIAVSHPEDRLEREAEATASSFQRGGIETSSGVGAQAFDSVQRQMAADEEEEVQTVALRGRARTSWRSRRRPPEADRSADICIMLRPARLLRSPSV
jgi:hypothetical protein